MQGIPGQLKPSRDQVQDDKIRARRKVRFTGKPEPEGESAFGVVVTCLEEIIDQSLLWLWRDVLALGKVTLLTGPSGVGKTFVALDMVAAATKGDCDAEGQCTSQPADVLLMTPEYELADIVQARLHAAGGDAALVHAVRGVRRLSTSPEKGGCWLFQLNEDLRLLEREVAARQSTDSNLRMIVVDPFPVECFDSRAGEAELKKTIQHLAEMAAWSDTAILLVADSAVSQRGHAERIARCLENSVQSAWCVGPDLEHPERRLLLKIRGNFDPNTKGHAFTLHDGTVKWQTERVEMTAEQYRDHAFHEVRGPTWEQEWSELGRAKDWLRRRLKSGRVPVRTIRLEAEANDIAYTTLRRALCGLRGKSEQVEDSRLYAWSLPDSEIQEAPLPDEFQWDELIKQDDAELEARMAAMGPPVASIVELGTSKGRQMAEGQKMNEFSCAVSGRVQCKPFWRALARNWRALVCYFGA